MLLGGELSHSLRGPGRQPERVVFAQLLERRQRGRFVDERGRNPSHDRRRRRLGPPYGAPHAARGIDARAPNRAGVETGSGAVVIQLMTDTALESACREAWTREGLSDKTIHAYLLVLRRADAALREVGSSVLAASAREIRELGERWPRAWSVAERSEAPSGAFGCRASPATAVGPSRGLCGRPGGPSQGRRRARGTRRARRSLRRRNTFSRAGSAATSPRRPFLDVVAPARVRGARASRRDARPSPYRDRDAERPHPRPARRAGLRRPRLARNNRALHPRHSRPSRRGRECDLL